MATALLRGRGSRGRNLRKTAASGLADNRGDHLPTPTRFRLHTGPLARRGTRGLRDTNQLCDGLSGKTRVSPDDGKGTDACVTSGKRQRMRQITTIPSGLCTIYLLCRLFDLLLPKTAAPRL
ncbi:hypothetical protein LTLLF_132370 [Microtus ochrogaster]|uniref:Uncharacterized protein n=1 Tax=Microtus ochrogaster TaxID=79684 RepID=A0A8J6GQ69_MICOH|nr:hypothetical protein LTLLF_132370 [Microtus ochrogaster]